MIKFFRNIRKRHLMENKISKYLKYAIGEIVLVVIGILIALSINNWNESRKDAIREKEILQDLKTSLEGDIKNQIERNLIDLTQDIENIEIIIATIKKREPISPEIEKKFRSLMYSKSFTWEITAYKNLENAGANIIKNKTLKNAILRIYNTNYPTCKEYLSNFSENLMAFFRPQMREKFKFNYDSKESRYVPLNYDELLVDPIFMNTLLTAKINFNNNYENFENTKQNVEVVIELINQELKIYD